MEFDDYFKKLHNSIRDKLKLFLYLIYEFETYLKNKKDKDSQLSIDKIQRDIVDQIIQSENLKILIVMKGANMKKIKGNDDKGDLMLRRERTVSTIQLNETESPLQFYRTLSKSPENATISSEIPLYITRTKFIKKKNINSSCFGQNSINSVKLFYKTANEIFTIREDILSSMKKKIEKKIYLYLENCFKLETKKNFVLTNIHSSTTENATSNNFKRYSSINSMNKFDNLMKKNSSQSLASNDSPKNGKNSLSKKLTLFVNNEKGNIVTVTQNFPILKKVVNDNKIDFNNNHTYNYKILNSQNNNNSIQIGIDDFIRSVKYKAKYHNSSKEEKPPNFIKEKERIKNIKRVYSNMLGFKALILDRNSNIIMEKERYESNLKINKAGKTRNQFLFNVQNRQLTNPESPIITTNTKTNTYANTIFNTGSVNSYTTTSDSLTSISKQMKIGNEFNKNKINSLNEGLSSNQLEKENGKLHKMKISLNYNYNGTLKIDKKFRKGI